MVAQSFQICLQCMFYHSLSTHTQTSFKWIQMENPHHLQDLCFKAEVFWLLKVDLSLVRIQKGSSAISITFLLHEIAWRVWSRYTRNSLTRTEKKCWVLVSWMCYFTWHINCIRHRGWRRKLEKKQRWVSGTFLFVSTQVGLKKSETTALSLDAFYNICYPYAGTTILFVHLCWNDASRGNVPSFFPFFVCVSRKIKLYFDSSSREITGGWFGVTHIMVV